MAIAEILRIVVDPANRLIKNIAVKLFNSVCGKCTFKEVEEEAVAVKGRNEAKNVHNAERKQRKKARREEDIQSWDDAGYITVEIAKDYMGAQSRLHFIKNPSKKLNGVRHQRARNRVQPLKYTPYVRNSREQARYPMHIGDGTSLSTTQSQWTPIESPITGGRQMLKKRSSSDGLPLGNLMRSALQKTSSYTPLSNFSRFYSTS
ncbi:uncharacterized protein LOC131054516 [Cryptomeria japonica]|uniref:uncharacterized protein LOC131054516 n=1 Tax=Cryptomeria japonica TaxID=3369 RepID=UPI0027DA04BA|nr:uncharacterized protein LOC131054516 [Cryptomeria japonica]